MTVHDLFPDDDDLWEPCDPAIEHAPSDVPPALANGTHGAREAWLERWAPRRPDDNRELPPRPGELALLTRTRRTASVRAVQHSELLEINRVAFEHVLAADPSFTLSLCQRLASQLAANRSPVSRPEPPRAAAQEPSLTSG